MTADFEKLYLELREKENRVYSDSELIKLPDINGGHPHVKEWKQRKQSAQRLFNYLRKKNKPLNVLEIGCGNGWLSAFLAKNPNLKITGTDVNRVELDQARRVFSLPNISFIENELERTLEKMKFDVILFASSVQYFRSFSKIIELALSALNKNGEIHLIDTHFYKPEELDAAKKRSAEYYNSMGYPEMTDHYFHHSVSELRGFDHKFMWQGLFKRAFPWIVIRQRKL